MDMAALGFKLLNPTMNAILRSPLHRIVSRRIMAIEYEGVKSRKKYSVPVSYFRSGEEIYCFTDGKWWNNFKAERGVNLILNNTRRKASAIAVTDDFDSFSAVLSELIKKFPSDARYYGVQLGSDKSPLPGELDRAFNNNVMVKFTNVV